MVNILKKTLCFYLIYVLICLPLAQGVSAAKKKSVTVIEVYKSAPSAQLKQMHAKIENYLNQNDSINVKTQNFESTLTQQSTTPPPPPPPTPQIWTKGDETYVKAKDIQLNNSKSALQRVRNSITMLKSDPGISGNLFNAYLLKAQIEFELGNDDAAFQSALKAISYNVDSESLSSSAISPRMRYLYQKAYNRFLSTYQLTDMTINVKEGLSIPIYVNGVLRGTQSSLTIKVPRNTVQIISTGHNTYKHMVKSLRAENTIAVSAYNKDTAPVYYSAIPVSYQSAGLLDTFFPSLVTQAQSLGRNVKAQQAALIKVDQVMPDTGKKKRKKDHYNNNHYQMQLSVVNVKNGNATQTQLYNIPNIYTDADKIAKMASDYIANLSKQSFVSVNTNYWGGPQIAALQKGMSLSQSPGLNNLAALQGADNAQNIATLKSGKHLKSGNELNNIPKPKKSRKAKKTQGTQGPKKKMSKTLKYVIIGAAAALAVGGITAAIALSGGGGGSSGSGGGSGGSGGSTAEGDSTTILTGPVPTTP